MTVRKDFYDPNEYEKKLLKENILWANEAINLAYIAEAITEVLFVGSDDGDSSDAFRHCFWSALIAQKTSIDWAQRWTNAHEEMKDEHSLSHEMDFHNNLVEIQIIKDKFVKSQLDILKSCLSKV